MAGVLPRDGAADHAARPRFAPHQGPAEPEGEQGAGGVPSGAAPDSSAGRTGAVARRRPRQPRGVHHARGEREAGDGPDRGVQGAGVYGERVERGSTLPRHGRACSGHPRLTSLRHLNVDARHKAGHDGVCCHCREEYGCAASASRQMMDVVEKQLLPILRCRRDRSDPIHELRHFHHVLRGGAELEPRLRHHRYKLIRGRLFLRHLKIGFCRLAGVLLDHVDRLGERVEERRIELRIVLAEFRGRVGHADRDVAAEHLCRGEDRAHTGAFQLQIGKRRRAEMSRDLRTLGEKRRHRIGMRARDGEMVELVVLTDAPRLLGRHLEEDRLRRGPHRRDRNAVRVSEVLDGLDLRVLGDQRQRQRVVGGNAADIERAARPRPERQERRCAGRCDIEAAGNESVVHHVAAGKAVPRHLDVAQTRRLGVLLDQLAVVHQRERQVRQARLDRDAELAGFGMHRRGPFHGKEQRGQQHELEQHAFSHRQFS